MGSSLLSRVAGRVYWAARYIERAEDTARIVRAHGEMLADLPHRPQPMWQALIAIFGGDAQHDPRLRAETSETSETPAASETSEAAVVALLLSDRGHPASVVSCVGAARENLRTTREMLPRDAWQALNDLHLYVVGEVDRGVARRVRERFLGRVIGDSRRLDGIVAATMNHDEAYAMWRLGRAVERADMTTRVLGVRAASVLLAAGGPAGEQRRYDELEWMGVLRSLSALQMYQRAVRGPIDGTAVVRFLLEHETFPRAVRALLREIRRALRELPDPGRVVDDVDAVDAALRDATAEGVEAAALDGAMDRLQVALAQLDQRIHERYLRLA